MAGSDEDGASTLPQRKAHQGKESQEIAAANEKEGASTPPPPWKSPAPFRDHRNKINVPPGKSPS